MKNSEKEKILVENGWEKWMGDSWIKTEWIKQRLPYDRMATSLDGAWRTIKKHNVVINGIEVQTEKEPLFPTLHELPMFPIIKNAQPKLISNELKSVKPMTMEEAAGDRQIEEYPTKYDLINTDNELKEKIKHTLLSRDDLKTEWLEVSHIINMPFGTKDIYYKSYCSVRIACNKPKTHIFDDMRYCALIADLDPAVWSSAKVNKIIEEVTKELSQK